MTTVRPIRETIPLDEARALRDEAETGKLTKFSAQSTPRTSPRGPTRLAIRCVLSPKPHPTSSTRAPS